MIEDTTRTKGEGHPVSNTRVIGTIVILTESNNINFTTNTSSDNKEDLKTNQSEYLESDEIDGEEF